MAAATATATAGSKRSFPDAAADSNRRVQPRHFHAEPNPAAAGSSSGHSGAAAEEPDAPPPSSRLYRHALESIFAFLDQRELARALQVSHSWLDAVKSMSSLRLTINKPAAPLRVVAESAVGRHVAGLGGHGSYLPLIPDSLFIVARLMPQLHELNCNLPLPPAQGPLTFPPGLRELRMVIGGNPELKDVNAAIEAISCLSLLETFAIYLFDFGEQLSFAPLARLPHLRNLSLNELGIDEEEDQDEKSVKLSDAHVDQLRALPLLRRLDVRPMSTSLLRRLLAQPHELQWQQISLPRLLNDEAAALLAQLPSLTAVGDMTVRFSCSRFDFLRQLPQLTYAYLKLTINRPIVAGRIESLLAGLQCCSQIQMLVLDTRLLSAAHLTELLPRLPRLSSLSLGNSKITTLSFLAQEPMTHQLASLQLSYCRGLPLTELRHVHSLQRLKGLHLVQSFNAPMDAHCQSLYTPPSLLMPQLGTFVYKQP